MQVEPSIELDHGSWRGQFASRERALRHTLLHPTVRAELLQTVVDRAVGSEETIFYGESRPPRGHTSFHQRFKRLLADWGGKKIRFHDLRHTAITLWVHSGINLRVIQEMAGHESITTTMGYSHMVGGSINMVSRMHVIIEDSAVVPALLSSSDDVRSSSDLEG